jgi:cytidyltransferase-like protein
MSPKYVVVSGYFDPIHKGHLEYFEMAKKHGDILVVIVNNDQQSILKKNKYFMKCSERLQIIRSLRCVDFAIESVDEDRTVRKTLSILHPYCFCNGGDQNNSSIPEAEICREMNIKLIDGLGDKIQSSSWLLKSNEEIEKDHNHPNKCIQLKKS